MAPWSRAVIYKGSMSDIWKRNPRESCELLNSTVWNWFLGCVIKSRRTWSPWARPVSVASLQVEIHACGNTPDLEAEFQAFQTQLGDGVIWQQSHVNVDSMGSACHLWQNESARVDMSQLIKIRCPPEPQKASDELCKEPGSLQSTELARAQSLTD